jgi:hypothetical protein
MFILSYVNIGLVIFVVNFNIGKSSTVLATHNVPIFNG